MSKIKIVSGRELHGLANRITRQMANDFNRAKSIPDKLSFNVAFTLFTGDRIMCFDEGIVFARAPLRGMATIAQQGEQHDGQPTIVGVYVRLANRGKGFGSILLEAAVRRCLERGFDNIRVDAISRGGKRLIEKLPEELLAYLDVHDLSRFSLF